MFPLNELRANHLAVSKIHADFMDEMLRQGAVVQPIDRSNLPQDVFPYPLNGWPYLADHAFGQEAARAAETVMALLRLVPERIFKWDFDAICQFYKYSSTELARLVMSQPNGMNQALTRPDFLLTQDGLKCMEANVSCNLGGIFSHHWVPVFLQQPVTAQFVKNSGLTPVFTNPLEVCLQHFHDIAVAADLVHDHQITIAKILWHPEADAGWNDEDFEAMANAYLARTGSKNRFRYLTCGMKQFTVKNDAVYLGEDRVDVIVQDRTSRDIIELYKQAKVAICNSPASYKMTDKRSLALISEHEDSDVFTAQERADIKQYIPWTRRLRESKTGYRDETVDLVKLVRLNPENFVLKKGLGLQGGDVILGHKCNDDEWKERVDKGVSDGDWLVQEILSPLPLMGLGRDGEMMPHQVIWGLYCIGEKYGGAFLRSQPMKEESSGIVNSANGAVESVMLTLN